MKFTVSFKKVINLNLSEVDISEDRLIEDFGSVENFHIWVKRETYNRKEQNLLKKLLEKFPMDVEDYIKSVGTHIQSFEGFRFDTLNGVYEGGLDEHQHMIDYDKSVSFKKGDGTSVKEIKIEFG